MIRGRKHRYGTFAAGWLAAALALLVVLAPASALADSGDCEYCLTVPTGDGNGKDPTAQTSGGGADQPQSSDGSTSVDSTGTATGDPATDESDDDSDQGAGAGGKGDSNGGGGGGKEGAGTGKGVLGDSLEATPGGDATGAASTESDSGGISPLLIVIAVIAAACAGLAVWRLRGRLNLGGSRAETDPPGA